MTKIQKLSGFDYVKPTTLSGQGSPPDPVVSSMGFYMEKGKYKYKASVCANYILSCVTLVKHFNMMYIYNYKKGIFAEVDDYNLPSAIRVILDQTVQNGGPYLWSKSIGNALEEELKAVIGAEVFDFNKEPYIVFKNGAFNTETFTFEGFKISQLATRQIDYDYDASAECPRFQQFLREVTCDQPDLALQMQQMIGYLLASHNIAEKSFIIVGPARNGKSTLASVITKMLGADSVSATPLKELGGQFGLEDLVDKRANITTESDRGEPISTAVWKSITSNDSVSINGKGKKRYTAKLHTKMVAFLNYYPQFDEVDEAIKRRLIILPMTAEIPTNKIDPHLGEKLERELPGIMNWAIEGLKSLSQNNWVFADAACSQALLDNFLTQSDGLLRFIKEELEVDNTLKESVKISELSKAYNLWASGNGFESIKRTAFSDAIKSKLKLAGISYSEVSSQGYAKLKGLKMKNSRAVYHENLIELTAG